MAQRDVEGHAGPAVDAVHAGAHPAGRRASARCPGWSVGRRRCARCWIRGDLLPLTRRESPSWIRASAVPLRQPVRMGLNLPASGRSSRAQGLGPPRRAPVPGSRVRQFVLSRSVDAGSNDTPTTGCRGAASRIVCEKRVSNRGAPSGWNSGMPMWTVRTADGEDERIEAELLATDGGALVALSEAGLLLSAWAPGQWRRVRHVTGAGAPPAGRADDEGRALVGVARPWGSPSG
jgi:hypothetical protein